MAVVKAATHVLKTKKLFKFIDFFYMILKLIKFILRETHVL